MTVAKSNPYGFSLIAYGASSPIPNSINPFQLTDAVTSGATWIRWQRQWQGIENPQSTTSNTAISTTGSHTVTPASMMSFIFTGQTIQYDTGGANQEQVTITATTGSTFTATFAKTHLTGVTISAIPAAGANPLPFNAITNPNGDPVRVAPYDWSIPDDVVSKCNQAGINVDLTIQNAPTWHLQQECAANTNHLIPADTAFFATQMATRYNGTTTPNPLVPGTFLFVASIEVGNEGYDDQGVTPWPCRNGKYAAQCLQAVYPVIKAASPNTLVGAAALLNHQLGYAFNWITGFFSNTLGAGGSNIDGGLYCDYLNMHYYSCYGGTVYMPDLTDPAELTLFPSFQNCVDVWTTFSQVATSYGHGNLPVWVTETSVPNPSQGGCHASSDQQQSDYLFHIYEAARKSNIVQRVFWFDMGNLIQNNGVFHQAWSTLNTEIANYPQWTPPVGVPAVSRRDGTVPAPPRRDGTAILAIGRRDATGSKAKRRRGTGVGTQANRRDASGIPTLRRRG